MFKYRFNDAGPEFQRRVRELKEVTELFLAYSFSVPLPKGVTGAVKHLTKCILSSAHLCELRAFALKGINKVHFTNSAQPQAKRPLSALFILFILCVEKKGCFINPNFRTTRVEKPKFQNTKKPSPFRETVFKSIIKNYFLMNFCVATELPVLMFT